MQKRVRGVAGFGFVSALGLLVQNKFHGLSLGTGTWLVLTWIVLGMCVALVLLAETTLRERRPTLHMGPRNGGHGVLIWYEPAERPLFAGRHARADAKRREVELGQRAIRVGGDVLRAYNHARASVPELAPQAGESTNEQLPAYLAAYQTALNELKQTVGAAWSEVLQALKATGAFDGHRFPPEPVSVNFTGLDSDAVEVQAVGPGLLRKQGVGAP